MAKRRSTNNSHIGRSVAAFLLALVVIGACVIGGLQLWGKGNQKPSEWFKKKEASAEPRPEYSTVLPTNGGMTMPEALGADTSDETGNKSQGIALMSAAIPVAQYAAYGVPSAAENAKTVTATVSPDNEASNTKIKWELAWKDAASAWATGKQPSEYIKLQTNADDLMESKKCTVSCLQPFGEQLELKAVAVDDETKFATVNVDYVQQVKSVKVNIGDVSVNLGGNTDITIAIRRDYNGNGGEITATPIYGDVYTIENVFTANVSLKDEKQFTQFADQSRKYFNFFYESRTNLCLQTEEKDYVGETIYFDTRFFETFKVSQYLIKKDGFQWSGSPPFEELYPETKDSYNTLYWKNFTANEIKACYENLHCQGKVLFTMKVCLTSGSYEYNYESEIVWAAIDETVPPTKVDINDGNDLLFP